MQSEIATRRTLRLPRRPPLAGDVLRRLPVPTTAADVLHLEADILSLPPRERDALRFALVGRLDPEDMAALRPLFGRPAPAPDPWPPADAAALIRATRRIAEALGWRPGADTPPLPHQALRGVSGPLMRLPRAERESAARILAGLCDWTTGADLLEWAAHDTGIALDEPNEPATRDAGAGDEEAESAAAEAFRALPEEAQRDLADPSPQARWRGAKAAVRAGMPLGALALILKEAGERDPEGMVRRAVAAVGGGRRAG